MYWLKGCSRCGGDLHDEDDVYGAYVACVQCGYVLRDEEEVVLRATGSLELEVIRPAERAA